MDIPEKVSVSEPTGQAPKAAKLPENIATNWVSIIAIASCAAIGLYALSKGAEPALIGSTVTAIVSIITVYTQRRTASEAKQLPH